MDECTDGGMNIRVVWTTTHTTLEEKATMSPQNRQVVSANEKVDELAKTGAIEDGAEVAERIAEDAIDTRMKVCATIRYAATCRDEVLRSLLTQRKSARKTKISLSGFVALRKLKFASTEWSERVEGKKKFHCMRFGMRGLYDRVSGAWSRTIITLGTVGRTNIFQGITLQRFVDVGKMRTFIWCRRCAGWVS